MKRVLFRNNAPHIVMVANQDIPEMNREFIKTASNTVVATGTLTAVGAGTITDGVIPFPTLLGGTTGYVYLVGTSGASPYIMEGAPVTNAVAGTLTVTFGTIIPAAGDTYYLVASTTANDFIDFSDREWYFGLNPSWFFIIEDLTEDKFDYYHCGAGASLAGDHLVFTRARRLLSITSDIAIDITFEDPTATPPRNAAPRPYPNGTTATYIQAAPSYPKLIGVPALPTVTNLDLQMLNFNTGVKEMWIMTAGAEVTVLAY